MAHTSASGLVILWSFVIRHSCAAPQAGLLALVLVAALGGCAVGPDYRRSAVDSPAAYRTAGDATAPAGTNSFADLGWWQVFQDPQLTDYIGEALTNNWDIKIAAARVLQAEGALKIARSQYVPTINAGGDIHTTRTSQNGPASLPSGVNPQRGYGDVFASMWHNPLRSQSLKIGLSYLLKTSRAILTADIARGHPA